MALGTPQTDKYKIGTAEVRIGPLSEAGNLKQSHSVGLLDNVTVDVTQESLDLLGGFPKVTVDTAVTKQEASFTATLREYSRRNIRVMLGESLEAVQPTDVASTLDTDTTVGATTISLPSGEGAGFTPEDIVVIYPDGRPEEITVARVVSKTTDDLTLDPGTPTLFDYAGTTETIHIYVARQVAIGNITQTNYFSVQVLQTERATGRPIGYNYWKATIASGLSDASNADDFASTELSIKLLVPAAAEYATGASLAHLSNIIPSHPTGMYFAGGD